MSLHSEVPIVGSRSRHGDLVYPVPVMPVRGRGLYRNLLKRCLDVTLVLVASLPVLLIIGSLALVVMLHPHCVGFLAV